MLCTYSFECQQVPKPLSRLFPRLQDEATASLTGWEDERSSPGQAPVPAARMREEPSLYCRRPGPAGAGRFPATGSQDVDVSQLTEKFNLETRACGGNVVCPASCDCDLERRRPCLSFLMPWRGWEVSTGDPDQARGAPGRDLEAEGARGVAGGRGARRAGKEESKGRQGQRRRGGERGALGSDARGDRRGLKTPSGGRSLTERRRRRRRSGRPRPSSSGAAPRPGSAPPAGASGPQPGAAPAARPRHTGPVRNPTRRAPRGRGGAAVAGRFRLAAVGDPGGRRTSARTDTGGGRRGGPGGSGSPRGPALSPAAQGGGGGGGPAGTASGGVAGLAGPAAASFPGAAVPPAAARGRARLPGGPRCREPGPAGWVPGSAAPALSQTGLAPP